MLQLSGMCFGTLLPTLKLRQKDCGVLDFEGGVQDGL